MIKTNSLNLKSSKNLFYRPEIDGIRAFAILCVIIYHFNNQFLPGGYLGVDIFFVISGFVITSSIEKNKIKSLKDFIVNFYSRRIKRLLPALCVFVLINSILICLFNSNPDLSLKTGITSLFGFSNIYLYEQSFNYFAESSQLNIFLNTWSLGVEAQFYILYPFFIWFSGFGLKTKNGYRNLNIILILLTTLSLFGFLFLFKENQPANYFLLTSRFWEIGTGCLIFLNSKKPLLKINYSEKIIPSFLIILIIFIMFLPIEFSSISTLSIVFLTSFLIITLRRNTLLYNFFINSKVVFLGKISYSLYLWHWSIITLSRFSIGIYWWTIPIQILIILLFSISSFKWIEKVFRDKKIYQLNWQNFLIILSMIFSFFINFILSEKSLKGKLYRGNYPHEKLITMSIDYEEKTNFSYQNCHFGEDNFSLKKAIKNCFLSDNKSSKTFYFVGNSHNGHFRETHHLINKYFDINIFSTSITGCVFPFKKNEDCKKSQLIISKWILDNINKGDIVFISNRHISNNEINLPIMKNYDWMKDKYTIEIINYFHNKVSERGAKIVLINPLPEYDVSLKECKPKWFKSFNYTKCTKTINQAREEKKIVYMLIKKYLNKEITIYDPLPAMCHNDICSMIDKKSKPLYFDDDHITDYANRVYIFPHFSSFLKKEKLL